MYFVWILRKDGCVYHSLTEPHLNLSIPNGNVRNFCSQAMQILVISHCCFVGDSHEKVKVFKCISGAIVRCQLDPLFCHIRNAIAVIFCLSSLLCFLVWHSSFVTFSKLVISWLICLPNFSIKGKYWLTDFKKKHSWREMLSFVWNQCSCLRNITMVTLRNRQLWLLLAVHS